MKIWRMASVFAVSLGVVCSGNSAAQTVSSAPGGNSIIEINGVFVGVNPLTVTPQSVFPRTVTPATVSPATVSPATVSPATVTPATVTPATVTPATVSPATVSPATVSPGSVTPAIVVPQSVIPQTVIPQTVIPQSVVPQSLVVPQSAPAFIAPPRNVTTAMGQQGSGTIIGQQGGIAMGQQGSGTAIGQQGFATSIIPPNNVAPNSAVVIGQPEPFTPPPVSTPAVIGFSPNLATAARPGGANVNGQAVNAQAGSKAVTPRTSSTPMTPAAALPPPGPPSGGRRK